MTSQNPLITSIYPEPADRPAHPFPCYWSWLILGCVALLYIGTCFTPVIFDDNEGLYAGAVREMHQRGDWLVPMSNGFPRVQKPPLVYWAMLISTALLGENEFALRLPNALATVGWITATYLIARRLGGERFGVASALVIASMLGVWVFNHLVQPEPFLACFISLALWCVIEARTSLVLPEKNGHWYNCFWAFLALGTMSKGLHGAIWPLGVVFLTAIFVPGWRPWLRPILTWRGSVIFLVLVVPWYAYMAGRFPGFLQAHFWNEQVGASLNTRFPADTKQLPVWQFYVQHLLFWLPWTLFLPASIHSLLRWGSEPQTNRVISTPAVRDAAKLFGIWIGFVLLSLIPSTRQDYYSMSCWGAVAIFLALPWMEDGRTIVPRSLLFVPCVLIALAGVGALILAGWTQLHLSHLTGAAAAPIQARDTFLDAITGISPALWESFLTLFWIFGAALFLAATMASILVWRRHLFSALLIFGGAGAIPVVLATIGFTMMSSYFSLAEDARAINQEMVAEPDAVIACEALPNTASSLLYYLNARVHWVNAPFDNQYAQQVLGLGRDYYLNEAEFLRLWHSNARVYFIVEESRLPSWRPCLGDSLRVVDQSGTRLVLSNRER